MPRCETADASATMEAAPLNADASDAAVVRDADAERDGDALRIVVALDGRALPTGLRSQRVPSNREGRGQTRDEDNDAVDVYDTCLAFERRDIQSTQANDMRCPSGAALYPRGCTRCTHKDLAAQLRSQELERADFRRRSISGGTSDVA